MIALLSALVISLSIGGIPDEVPDEESTIASSYEVEEYQNQNLRSVNGNNLQGGTYLLASTSELGDIKIYVDKEYSDCWGLDNNKPVLLHSSSITGYYIQSNNLIRITINPYSDVWSYRNVSGNYQSYDLHVTGVDLDDSNIKIDGQYAEYVFIIVTFLIVAVLLIFILR